MTKKIALDILMNYAVVNGNRPIKDQVIYIRRTFDGLNEWTYSGLVSFLLK